MKHRRAVLPVGLALAAVFSVGALADRLREVESQSTVRLTTIGRKSGEPRTVTIWFVHEDGRVYLQSGRKGETDWYRNARKNPQVALDFGSFRLRGRAKTIEDPREVERIHGVFLEKYWLARVGRWLGRGFGTGKVVAVEIDPASAQR